MPHDEDCDGCPSCFVVDTSALPCPICKKTVGEHDELTAAMHAFDLRRQGLVTDEQFRNAVVRAGGDQ